MHHFILRSLHNMSTNLAAILDFSNILFSAKVQQILLKLVKHVFAASSRNIIKNSV